MWTGLNDLSMCLLPRRINVYSRIENFRKAKPLIKVVQTELADYSVKPPVRGNCLAACVASIFEVPLAGLPDVYDSQSLWRWLNEHFPAIGMISHVYYDRYATSIDPNKIEGVPLGSRVPIGFTNLPGATPWIAVVRSRRTPHMHCVVMIGDKMVWDPHPARDLGVGDQTGDYAFTLDRPERLIRTFT